MHKMFKRVLSIVLALTMCLATSLVAFAAEEVPADEEVVVSSQDAGVMPMSIGMELYSKSKYFTSSTIISITTGSDNWDADFSVAVFGNSSGRYRVTMTAANGSTQTTTIYGNGAPSYFNMTYAKAGTYTFSFSQLSGSIVETLGQVKIYD